ncbi:MAG: hypothetical protein F6K19_08890 [Cyanothece sp. SIO1E1]|nr:hypothetical protein [Cyanothece sp. SIO1E1]
MNLAEFFNELKPAQATLISSVISALIALSVVGINRIQTNRKIRKEKYDAVKMYANPIVLACEQLAWRLKEILEFNGIYLLPDAPTNGFFKYKFDSSVYRLCAVIGWIYAAKKEQSYIQSLKFSHHKEIQSKIYQFQRTLADGSHVEVSIIDDLINLYDLQQGDLSDQKKGLIGVELERIVFTYIPDNVKRNVKGLDKNDQIKMVTEILDYLCDKTQQSKLDIDVIEKKVSIAVKEISREYCWIYRDWQSAIGEIMIEKIENASRRFDVIGFPEFQQEHESNEWLKKVDGLFSSLDVSIDDRFDSRVQQLKQLFGNTVELIEVFKSLVKKQETILDKSYEDLSRFKSEINEK